MKEQYKGGRTRLDIVDFLIQSTGPPVTKVSCDLLSEKNNRQELSMAFFGEPSGADYDTFFEVASESKKVKFFNVQDKGCPNQLGVPASAASHQIVFFRNFD